MMLDKTLESPVDSKEIKLVNPKGNQPWIFIERNDAEAEAPILGRPDVKNQLTRKNPDAGKDWRQQEMQVIEDKMVGWHHQLDGEEFEQAPTDGEGHRNPECCSPWGWKESDTTGQLNNHHHYLTEEIELFVNLTQSNTEERSNLTNYPKEFKFKGIAILDFPGGPVVKSLPSSTGAMGPIRSLGDPTCHWQSSPRATGTTSAL